MNNTTRPRVETLHGNVILERDPSENVILFRFLFVSFSAQLEIEHMLRNAGFEFYEEEYNANFEYATWGPRRDPLRTLERVRGV